MKEFLQLISSKRRNNDLICFVEKKTVRVKMIPSKKEVLLKMLTHRNVKNLPFVTFQI